MAQPAGEAQSDALRLDFDHRLKLEFHGSSVTSDAGLLAYRELDDALGLMAIADRHLVDGRTGRNGRHDLVGMLRQLDALAAAPDMAAQLEQEVARLRSAGSDAH